MKIKSAFLATTLFVLLLGAIHYAHVSLLPVNVVFYAAIGDGVLAAVLTGVALYGFSCFKPLGGFEKAQLIVIWLLAGYGFAISVPTVIDRSLSMYILEKLQQRGGGIKLANFEDVFTKEYVKEHRLVDVRLTEQMESGTVVITNGCVKLTEKGAAIAQFSRFYRQHLLPRQRLLFGKYSDDLTDPFKHSKDETDYKCN